MTPYRRADANEAKKLETTSCGTEANRRRKAYKTGPFLSVVVGR
jgi:hypothetical protein